METFLLSISQWLNKESSADIFTGLWNELGYKFRTFPGSPSMFSIMRLRAVLSENCLYLSRVKRHRPISFWRSIFSIYDVLIAFTGSSVYRITGNLTACLQTRGLISQRHLSPSRFISRQFTSFSYPGRGCHFIYFERVALRLDISRLNGFYLQR